MSKELVLLDVTKINAVEVFSAAENIEPILKSIETQALSIVTDVSTDKGRKEIASLAFKVAQSKTALDDCGKILVSEWKAKTALVDSCRKQARDFLDDLKLRVRQPLTDFENAEAARIEAARVEKERLEREERQRIETERLKAQQEAAEREAALRKELEDKNKELLRLQEEARQKELSEQRAREQGEREERLKAEAAEKAKREEQQRQQEIERQRLAKEQAEAAEVARKKAEEEKRIADVQHRNKVKQAILAKLSEFLAEDPAILLVSLVDQGEIPHMKIIY